MGARYCKQKGCSENIIQPCPAAGECLIYREKENGFVINQKLPSLNEYIGKLDKNRYSGAQFKKETESGVELDILKAIKSGDLTIPKPPVRIKFIWHEKTKRRDADNIVSAKKYILDAMQRMEIIANDNRKNVKGFTDEIVDDERDFVEVKIEEIPETPSDGRKRDRFKR